MQKPQAHFDHVLNCHGAVGWELFVLDIAAFVVLYFCMCSDAESTETETASDTTHISTQIHAGTRAVDVAGNHKSAMILLTLHRPLPPTPPHGARRYGRASAYITHTLTWSTCSGASGWPSNSRPGPARAFAIRRPVAISNLSQSENNFKEIIAGH